MNYNIFYDPRDDAEKVISPETAFRYRRRFGGDILLTEAIRTEPVRIIQMGPTLINNEKTIAYIKRNSLMEDVFAFYEEKWGEKGLSSEAQQRIKDFKDARAHARKLREEGVSYIDIPDIIKERWGERVADHVAALRGTEYFLSVPGVEE